MKKFEKTLQKIKKWFSRLKNIFSGIHENKHVIVYVRLLNEGTIVYRPVHGERLTKKTARLIAPDDYDPQDEQWEFPPWKHSSN